MRSGRLRHPLAPFPCPPSTSLRLQVQPSRVELVPCLPAPHVEGTGAAQPDRSRRTLSLRQVCDGCICLVGGRGAASSMRGASLIVKHDLVRSRHQLHHALLQLLQ